MSQDRDGALDQLDALVGEWDVEATHPKVEGAMRGRNVFEWLPGRRFLINRSDMTHGVPSSISVIGGGDTPGTWPMYYFDSRGVERVYQATFDRGVLRIRRDHPGFAQRFRGTFEDGGRTIRGHWELDQGDGFKPDLEIVYRRR